MLSAKPIIDIAVGINNNSELDLTIDPMIENKYIYYEVYNKIMPRRRLFVGLKKKIDFHKFQEKYSNNEEIPNNEINNLRLCHIHIWKFGSSEWKRHIAFREYLKKYPVVCEKYAYLKNNLSEKNWVDGNEYNSAKNNFIKQVESEAYPWYNKYIKDNI